MQALGPTMNGSGGVRGAWMVGSSVVRAPPGPRRKLRKDRGVSTCLARGHPPEGPFGVTLGGPRPVPAGRGCRELCLAFGWQAPGPPVSRSVAVVLGCVPRGVVLGGVLPGVLQVKGRLPPSRGLHAWLRPWVVASRSAALLLRPLTGAWGICIPQPLVHRLLSCPCRGARFRMHTHTPVRRR